jgi:hypothetical protein
MAWAGTLSFTFLLEEINIIVTFTLRSK